MAMYFFICLIAASHALVNGEIVGVATVPHGGYALDPYQEEGNPSPQGTADAVAIHHAFKELSQRLDEEWRPDIIVLSSPHAISHENDFLIYSNEFGSGCSTASDKSPPCSFPQAGVKESPLGSAHEGEPKEVSVRVRLASEVAKSMHSYLSHDNRNVSMLTAFSADSDIPLQWGELIPLAFIKSVVLSPTSTSEAELLVISQPRRRVSEGPAMVGELLGLGANLYDFLESQLSDKRVVVLISGDLAHTHSVDGPYGFSPSAKPFDLAIKRWLESGDRSYLVDFASILQPKALSCGYTGFVMLQGLLDRAGREWQGQVMGAGVPTYYGMAVAQVSIS